MDDDTPGKQPPGPMTRGNMRALGPRALDVQCRACGHHTSVDVDDWPDDTPVPSFGPANAMQEVRPSRRQRVAGLERAAWHAGKSPAMTSDLKAQIASEIYTAWNGSRTNSEFNLLNPNLVAPAGSN